MSKSNKSSFVVSIVPVYAILAIVAVHLMVDITSTLEPLMVGNVQLKGTTKTTATGIGLGGYGDDGPRCVGLGDGGSLDEMIAKHDMIYVVFPAKAAGSTMKQFTMHCLDRRIPDNVLEKDDSMRIVMRNKIDAPPFLSSHLYTSDSFRNLLRDSITNSMTIYLYRNESERLQSAIKHVITHRKHARKTQWTEDELMEVIQTKEAEIGNGSTRLLNCQAYDAIEENAPNLLFLDYAKVERLMTLLTKHHCPGFVPKNTHVNQGTKNDARFVTDGLGTEIGIDEWLEAKSKLLEHTLLLRDEASCMVKTKKMEHDLYSCPDGALHYSSSDFFAPPDQLV